MEIELAEMMIDGKVCREVRYRGMRTRYFVSIDGDVYSTPSGNKKSTHLNAFGYPVVSLSIRGYDYSAFVRRLVATAFIPNPENKPQVNHIDSAKTNNKVENLEWVTAKENTAHAIAMGLKNPRDKSTKARGENAGKNIYKESLIHQVCKVLEEGYGPTRISRMLPIDLKSVDSIKRGKNWVEVSSQYNIQPPRPRVPLSPKLERNIIDLAKQGLSGMEIMEVLELGNRKSNLYLYEQIQWIRRKVREGKI